MSINRVIISGNLTRDSELRQTQGGSLVLSFGVAVNDRRKNPQTQEWEDYANFVDCTMFGPRAEKLAQYLVKGLKVCVEGKLRYSAWARDGQRRSKLEIIVDDLEFMSSRQEQPSASPQVAHAAQQAASGYQPPRFQEVTQGVYDSDIPF